MASERRPLTADETAQIQARAQARVGGSLYDVLGVATNATAAEIEAAYHDIARSWHPDRFYSRDTGVLGDVIEENFVSATQAFRTLRDTTRRSAYDREAGIVAAPRAAGSSGGATAAPATGPRAPTPAGRAPAPPPPPAPRRGAPPAVEKIRQQLAEQLARARQYYLTGKEDYEAGRFGKAESALYLAVQFDPRNAEYAALHATASAKARELRAQGLVAQALQEETYARPKEAMALYEKAIACDPPQGTAWHRLGLLLLAQDQDARGALARLRMAVQKEPNNVTFRMALADFYEAQGLAVNAVREANAALAADPRCEPARAMVKRLRA